MAASIMGHMKGVGTTMSDGVGVEARGEGWG